MATKCKVCGKTMIGVNEDTCHLCRRMEDENGPSKESNGGKEPKPYTSGTLHSEVHK